MDRLADEGVATRPGTHAVHALGYYRDRFGLRADNFPEAWACECQSMAIPLHNRMTEEHYGFVVERIKAIA